jgi:hypothetical protein
MMKKRSIIEQDALQQQSNLVETGVTYAMGERNPAAMTKEEVQNYIANLRARDAELITGTFRNVANPSNQRMAGAAKFSICLYPGDRYKVYELRDGYKYTLPRGVVKHLVLNCYKVVHENLPGELGQMGIMTAVPTDGLMRAPSQKVGRKFHRFAFDVSGIQEDEDFRRSDLVEVKSTY